MTFKSSCKRLLCHRPQVSLCIRQQKRIIPSFVAAAAFLDARRSCHSKFHSAATAAAAAAAVVSSSSWENNDGVMHTISKSKISPRLMTRILEHHQGSSSSREMTKRFFFASSTNHTTLLAQAEIHVLPVADPTTTTTTTAADNDKDGITTTTTTTTTQQIVLAPSGMDFDMVRKVPQLHMARLLLTTTTTTTTSCTTTTNDINAAVDDNSTVMLLLHSAKVVNRSLGSTVTVCRRLLEYAMDLQQQQQQNGKKTSCSSSSVKIGAKSTLHGLSEWVVLNLVHKNNNETARMTEKIRKGNNDDDINNVVTSFVANLSTEERQIVQAIAKGDMTPFQSEHSGGQEEEVVLVENGRRSRTAAELWDQLARLYLASGSTSVCESSEAALYQSLLGEDGDGAYSCRLVAIEQQADTSDYSTMAGGAMAVFQLN